MRQKRRDWHALLALDNLIIARELVIVGLVGREFGAMQLSRILAEKRKRRNGVCEWFLYGSHMQCYRRSTLRSMANDVDNYRTCGKRAENAEPQLPIIPFLRPYHILLKCSDSR